VIRLLVLIVIFFADEQIAGGCRVVNDLAANGLLVLGDGGFLFGNGDVFGGLFFGLGNGAALLRSGGTERQG